MKLDDGKDKFIAEWGSLSMNWGVNRTMGQIQALLLVSCCPLCAEDIMEDLKVSRGNVNMNIRSLIDLGLVKKILRCGERKEYFEAEKDIWKVLKCIIAYRKKKELDPMVELLANISAVQGKCDESNEFCKMVTELNHYSQKADQMLNTILKSKINFLDIAGPALFR